MKKLLLILLCLPLIFSCGENPKSKKENTEKEGNKNTDSESKIIKECLVSNTWKDNFGNFVFKDDGTFKFYEEEYNSGPNFMQSYFDTAEVTGTWKYIGRNQIELVYKRMDCLRHLPLHEKSREFITLFQSRDALPKTIFTLWNCNSLQVSPNIHFFK